jgi:hypothetical protein
MLVLSEAGLAQVCAPTGIVKPNSKISGALDGTNCTLADGTWFADYLVDFPSRGSWSASVAAADGTTAFTVLLRDQSGARIDSGGSINRTVERGTYHVLVNAPASNQGGGYTLTSNFSSAPSILCRHFAMMGTLRPVSGSLGSGSCTLPDGSAFDGYQLTLYGTGTVDVAIQATGFTPLLILRTSDGHAIASNSTPDDSGVVHLTVPEVGSDTYTLVASVSSPDQAGGAYSLNSTFTVDSGESCVSLATLGPAQLYNGSIDTASCNFNLPGREDAALFNYYQVHLDSPGAVQASIDSADFSSLLLLLDADGNAIADDLDSGGAGTPLIRQQLPAGDYLLIIFNEDSFGGSYALNYQFAAGPASVCPVTGIDSGNQMTGILAGSSSCKDSVFLSDAYKLVLPDDGTVNLSLSSPDFSTFLDLHDAKDSELTWGTQSSDGSASFITADMPAGTYYVYAASMDMPGGYALSYTFTPKTLPACPMPMPLQYNEYIQNTQLGPASCEGPDGRRSDSYKFTLPSAATEAVVMTSDTLTPDITLYMADGTPLRNDQNSYADDNAIIIQNLPAGDYVVKAKSADPTTDGLYNLYLLFAPGGPPQLCTPLSLPASGVAAGTTSFTSCAWFDKTFADVYQVNVTGSTQILTIGAQSTDFDSFLVLMDSKGNVLTSDDNSGGGQNALLVQSLDPGSYFVVVKPANDPTSTGAYTLTSVASAPPDVGTQQREAKKF